MDQVSGSYLSFCAWFYKVLNRALSGSVLFDWFCIWIRNSHFTWRTALFQRGYDDLQSIVPTCQQTEALGPTKLSKATILQRCKYYHIYIAIIARAVSYRKIKQKHLASHAEAHKNLHVHVKQLGSITSVFKL